jgi:flagellar biosynthesis protein FlhB
VSEAPSQPATPRALAGARARGDFPFSSAWTSAAVLTCAALGASYWGPRFGSVLRRLSRAAWSGQPPTAADAAALLSPFVWFLLALCAGALVLVAAQRAPTWRVWSAGNAARAPRVRVAGKLLGAWGLGVTAIELSLVAALLIVPLYASLPGVLASSERGAQALIALLGTLAVTLAERAAIALLLAGAIELAAQQIVRLQRLRMTRREVLEEARELAGDPRVARELRQRASAHTGELAEASLVLTGAGRALALRYVPERDAAPVLWTKAEAQAALQLVGRAYALGLPLASDDLLASDLYRLEPNQPIPLASHARVAALLVAAGKS